MVTIELIWIIVIAGASAIVGLVAFVNKVLTVRKLQQEIRKNDEEIKKLVAERESREGVIRLIDDMATIRAVIETKMAAPTSDNLGSFKKELLVGGIATYYVKRAVEHPTMLRDLPHLKDAKNPLELETHARGLASSIMVYLVAAGYDIEDIETHSSVYASLVAVLLRADGRLSDLMEVIDDAYELDNK